jgi:ferredoxin
MNNLIFMIVPFKNINKNLHISYDFKMRYNSIKDMMHLVINKSELKKLFNTISGDYTLVGPRLKDGVIVLDRIDYDDIPSGFEDIQQPGHYRLRKKHDTFFSFHPGPHSLKNFLHPSLYSQHSFERSKRSRLINAEHDRGKPYAFIGMRACDIKALEIMNKVFEGIDEKVSGYFGHRKIFIVAVSCVRPSDNCFCSSMNAGPKIKNGFDILLADIKNEFMLDIGSAKGEHVCMNLNSRLATGEEVEEIKKRTEECGTLMKKKMNVDDLPQFLYRQFESSVWKDVAARCLACGNCTQVCPTCFCNSSFDIVTLSGMQKQNEFSGKKMKKWDSCFSKNFARVHGGNFRFSRNARYRHWFNHKFGYWLDQFGISGCVGCGRCITWCPVGIDVAEEMEKLRGKY